MQPITYFNRYTGCLEQEAVYGEGFLKWAYGRALGRATVELLVKRSLFSRFYGWWMSRPASAGRIKPFVETFQLDVSEFAQALEDYGSFNDFFSRRLKPHARPIDPDPASIVFPADGRHLGFQDLSSVSQVFVKGQRFDLATFLGDSALAAKYQGGSAVLSRLCPLDYHRFHFATAGCPGVAWPIPGVLYSVNPMALRQRLSYLWENKRMLTRLTTRTLGEVLIVEIGATNVGSITQTFRSDDALEKGDEKGYFRFGGSATMTLFETGRVKLSDDLLHYSAQSIELYGKMGDVMGQAL